ncbi:hypothetical protein GRAN_2317 [Granulicella sibirica]|uniref:Uncharacterized protein n=1 Tax=Granulicella sibirica TaxID=2479048 RepID=A0A4Q0SZJ9_9BACT|nr:hypothetical protein GRAN_2317 [Granulicella sibirica]
MKHREFRVFNEDQARFCDLNSLAASHKYFDAQLRLQILYLLGEPRLGQMEAGSGTREVQLIG